MNTGSATYYCAKCIQRKEGCLCNIGVQECPIHPGRLRTKEEKIAFRKEWDRRVDEGHA